MKSIRKSLAITLIAAAGLSSFGAYHAHAGELLGDSDPVVIARHNLQDAAQAARDRLNAAEADVKKQLDTIQQNYFEANLAGLKADFAAVGVTFDEAKSRERATAKTEVQMVEVRKLAQARLDEIAEARKKTEADLSAGIAQLDEADPGEGAKALRITAAYVSNHWEDAKREGNPPGQLIKFMSGVSVNDIIKYGPLGGSGSEANKLVQTVGGGLAQLADGLVKSFPSVQLPNIPVSQLPNIPLPQIPTWQQLTGLP